MTSQILAVANTAPPSAFLPCLAPIPLALCFPTRDPLHQFSHQANEQK